MYYSAPEGKLWRHVPQSKPNYLLLLPRKLPASSSFFPWVPAFANFGTGVG
jgi:hypothetical protein